MSIQVTDFKYEKGKNDAKYIELLEKTLKNEQVITAKAVAKVRELAVENEKLKKECSRDKIINEFVKALKPYKYGRTNGIYIEIPLFRLEEIAEQMKIEV